VQAVAARTSCRCRLHEPQTRAAKSAATFPARRVGPTTYSYEPAGRPGISWTARIFTLPAIYLRWHVLTRARVIMDAGLSRSRGLFVLPAGTQFTKMPRCNLLSQRGLRFRGDWIRASNLLNAYRIAFND
jgi:hypothetical protein